MWAAPAGLPTSAALRSVLVSSTPMARSTSLSRGPSTSRDAVVEDTTRSQKGSWFKLRPNWAEQSAAAETGKRTGKRDAARFVSPETSCVPFSAPLFRPRNELRPLFRPFSGCYFPAGERSYLFFGLRGYSWFF